MASNSEVPWFKPELYAIETQDWVQKCIAPTLGIENRRCKKLIDKDRDLAVVNRLKGEICWATDAHAVVRKMRELVLLRCCDGSTSSHRGKLDTDGETIRLIAERYIDEFTRLRLLKVDVPPNLLLNDVTKVGQLELCPPEKEESLDALLRTEIDLSPKTPGGKPLPEEGYVYVLDTPWSGVLKIGFSGRSGQARQLEQEECLPGSRLLMQEFFRYPERIEQLIHLQLGNWRYKVMQCQNRKCRGTHIEFFQYPLETVKLILQDWKTLTDMEPLYNSNRCLTDTWGKRLDFMTVRPTAYSMIEMLKQQREENAAARAREEEARAQERRRVGDDLRQSSASTAGQVIDGQQQVSRPTAGQHNYNTRASARESSYNPALQSYGSSSSPLAGYQSQNGLNYVRPMQSTYVPQPMTYIPEPYSTTYDRRASVNASSYYPASQYYGSLSSPPTGYYPQHGQNYAGPTQSNYVPQPVVTYISQPYSNAYNTRASVHAPSHYPAPQNYGSLSMPTTAYYPRDGLDSKAPTQSDVKSQPVMTSIPQSSSTTYDPTFDLQSLADTLPYYETSRPSSKGMLSSLVHKFKNPTARLKKQPAW